MKKMRTFILVCHQEEDMQSILISGILQLNLDLCYKMPLAYVRSRISNAARHNLHVFESNIKHNSKVYNVLTVKCWTLL